MWLTSRGCDDVQSSKLLLSGEQSVLEIDGQPQAFLVPSFGQPLGRQGWRENHTLGSRG